MEITVFKPMGPDDRTPYYSIEIDPEDKEILLMGNGLTEVDSFRFGDSRDYSTTFGFSVYEIKDAKMIEKHGLKYRVGMNFERVFVRNLGDLLFLIRTEAVPIYGMLAALRHAEVDDNRNKRMPSPYR